jgi:ribonuclease R
VARIAKGNRAVALRKASAGAEFALERVIARHGLRTEFAPGAVEEARAAAKIPHAVAGRRDLRDVPTVTIDAPSTRDIDDAISVLPAGPDGALRLLVSIADVAEFVREDTALDRAARDRATSTYLAGRVLPMLPEELSSNWLSLLALQDRFCLTVELRIDAEGSVTATDLYESVIRSHARLNYTEVAAFLDRGEISSALEPVRASMPWFRAAAARIALSRTRRGGVEVARDETRIVFDEQTGLASGIESVRPTTAHAMIERFMVAANEAVARWLFDRGVPAPYRVHDEPDAIHVRDLAAFAHNFGFEAGFGRTLTPLALAAFESQIVGSSIEPAVRSVLLRSLGQARYTVVPSPHFGLAAPLYLHFTSPIRRYADLAVHRTLKAYLHGARDFAADDPSVETLAMHINQRARSAARAENDRQRSLVAEIMSAHVGEVFSARITRVRSFGLLAQIDTTLVEGSLASDSLPDGPYEPDERETALVSKKRTFAIGMPVRVRVVSTDPMLGRIELALAG